MRLVKRIPMQAGLGGGSSDAAAALVGLNRLWRLGLSRDELTVLGGQLGSDVAFFVQAEAAWCTGRGEVVEPAALGRTLHLVLVCPPFGCSTPEVYRGLSVPDQPLPGTDLRLALRQGDIDAIGRGLHNRLSVSAQRLAPRLADYLDKLRKLGPAGVLVSGSGSTVFALCRGRAEAEELARAYVQGPVDRKDKLYVVRSCASPLPV
jgi:4-diphosphocytidyl-2-C-methyl-D-erythritol kinase